MTNDQDPTRTIDPEPADPETRPCIPNLDKGLEAGFGPAPTPGGWSRPPVLRDDPSDQEPVVRPGSPEMPRGASRRYQPIGEIACGGMGVILKGRDPDLGRDLALKVLKTELIGRPAYEQRFVEEAQVGSQLQHPGLVPVYDLGRLPDGRPFIAMKLVKGRTLAALLVERPDPAHDRVRFLKVFEQTAQTVAYVHSRGVIHRDLKPANVMVGSFGEVQVMDWGLAKVLPQGGIADEERASRRAHPGGVHDEPTMVRTARTGLGSETLDGTVLGTPAFMPPEQAGGEIDLLDERADVFALGAVLCAILTGQPPYVADDAEAVWRMAARGDLGGAIERLDRCGADGELIGLCKRCLAPERDDRPRHAGEVADAMTAYLAAVEDRAHRAEVERAAAEARADGEVKTRKMAEARAAEERKRRRVQVALVGLGLLLAVGSVGFGWWADRVATQRKAERDRQAAERRQHVTDRLAETLIRVELLQAEAAKRIPPQVRRSSFKSRGHRGFNGILLSGAPARDPGQDTADQAAFNEPHDRAAELLGRAEQIALEPGADESHRQRVVEKKAAFVQAVGWYRDFWQRVERWEEVFRTPSRGVMSPIYGARLPEELGDERERCRKAVELLPDHAGTRAAYGVALIVAGEDSAGEAALRVAFELAGDDALAWVEVAEVCRRLPIRQESLLAARRAARCNIPDSSLRTQIARSLNFHGDRRAALELIESGIPTATTWDEVKQYSEHLSQTGHHDRAIQVVQGWERKNQRTAASQAQVAHLHASAGRYDEAFDIGRQAFLESSEAEASFPFMFAASQTGRWAEAVEAYREYLARRPNSRFIAQKYAQALVECGRTKEGVDRLLELARERGVLGRDRLAWRFRNEVHAGVAAILSNKIEKTPSDPLLHLALGYVRADQKREGDAAAAYKQVRRLAPRDTEWMRTLITLAGNDPEELAAIEKTLPAASDEKLRDPSELDVRSIRSLIEDRRAGIDRGRRVGEFLTALAAGKAAPASSYHAAEWAGEASRRGRHVLAVRLYRDAFSKVPIDADRTVVTVRGYRVDAARAAVQAGTGQGVDAPAPPDRPKLRRLAFDWLSVDLVALSQSLTSEPVLARRDVYWSAQNLMNEPAYGAVRHPIAVHYLPPDEREAWRAFWAEIRQIRDRTAATAPTPPPAR